MSDPASIIRYAFKGVTDEEVEALCRVTETKTYPASYILCHEGAIEHVFYTVAEGQVARVSVTHAGTTRPLVARPLEAAGRACPL